MHLQKICQLDYCHSHYMLKKLCYVLIKLGLFCLIEGALLEIIETIRKVFFYFIGHL